MQIKYQYQYQYHLYIHIYIIVEFISYSCNAYITILYVDVQRK